MFFSAVIVPSSQFSSSSLPSPSSSSPLSSPSCPPSPILLSSHPYLLLCSHSHLPFFFFLFSSALLLPPVLPLLLFSVLIILTFFSALILLILIFPSSSCSLKHLITAIDINGPAVLRSVPTVLLINICLRHSTRHFRTCQTHFILPLTCRSDHFQRSKHGTWWSINHYPVRWNRQTLVQFNCMRKQLLQRKSIYPTVFVFHRLSETLTPFSCPCCFSR